MIDPDYEDDLEGRGRASMVSELVRKAAVAGLGALFTTEEGIRNLAGQMKLPKEALGYVLAQAERTKSEVARVVSDEVRGFLHSGRLKDELHRLLAGMTIEVEAKIRLVPEKREGASEEKPRDGIRKRSRKQPEPGKATRASAAAAEGEGGAKTSKSAAKSPSKGGRRRSAGKSR